MIAAVLDTTALLKMLYVSLIAVISVAVMFSLVILGVTRASDTRRSGRSGVSAAYSTLAVAGLVICIAIVVYGLMLVIRK